MMKKINKFAPELSKTTNRISTNQRVRRYFSYGALQRFQYVLGFDLAQNRPNPDDWLMPNAGVYAEYFNYDRKKGLKNTFTGGVLFELSKMHKNNP